MLTPIYETLHITSEVSVIIVSVALMLFSGFAMTRIRFWLSGSQRIFSFMPQFCKA